MVNVSVIDKTIRTATPKTQTLPRYHQISDLQEQENRGREKKKIEIVFNMQHNQTSTVN